MKRLVVLASFAGMVLVVSGCGDAATEAASGMTAETQLNDLFERIDGGLQENQAAQLLARRHQQEAVQECMAQRDQKYVLDILDAPVWSEDTFRVGHGGTDWLQPLYGDLNIADSARQGARGDADLQDKSYLNELSAEDRAAYDSALDRCASAGDSAFVLFPEGHESLRASLVEVLIPYDKEAGERASEYADCMAGKGFDVESPVELFELVSAGFAKVNRADANYTQGSEFAAAETAEKQAAAADSMCRKDIYYGALASAASDVQEWAHSHERALEELDAQWAEWIKTAQAQPEAGRVLG